MRRETKNTDNMLTLLIGAKSKHMHECGGWGGKVLGMLTGGLIGDTGTSTDTVEVKSPTDVNTGSQATEAEQNERQKRKTGFKTTVGAGDTTSGGTATRSVLGG